jgi:hypothetical protein
MNPATGPFKGAPRSRYFVSHDFSPIERPDSAALDGRQQKAKDN